MTTAAVVLPAVGLFASLIPAWRASRVDPVKSRQGHGVRAQGIARLAAE
jgi:hypothetical protein